MARCVGGGDSNPKAYGCQLTTPSVVRSANYVTGAAEFLLGAALALAPLLGAQHSAARTARALFWLVVVMSPANINMWVNDVPFGKQRLTYGLTGTHALRCVLQIVLLTCLHGLQLGWQARASAPAGDTVAAIKRV